MSGIDYAKSEDAALIERWFAGDEIAIAELLNRYKPKVLATARRYYLQGGERDDLVQEGMIGLYEAIRKYEPGRPFAAFAEACIENRIVDAVRAAARFKHEPLNSSLSIDGPIGASDGDSGTKETLLQRLPADQAQPDTVLIQKEAMLDFASFLSEHLSERERAVMEKFLEGKSYREIAEELDVTVKSVDSALQRSRRKILEQREKNRDASTPTG